MPGREYYQGLSLADKLRRCAEHHYEARTRHLALFEYELLLEAADRLKHGRLGSPEMKPQQGRLEIQQSA